jgi:hypothetical protein
MEKLSLYQIAVVAALAIGAGACSGTMDDGSNSKDGNNSGQYELVPQGKADNFHSNVANEYELVGTIPVQMTEEEYEDEEERRRQVSRRTTAVGLYLTAYLTDKLEDFFENMGYGGFQAMVRNHSFELEEVEQGEEENTYLAEYTVDVAGPKDLMSQLAQTEEGDHTEEGVAFSFPMPKGATSDPENVERGEFRDFDPEAYDGELEMVELVGNPHTEISNAYPHYKDFVSDGVYDITMFYGYDYNEERYDLEGAKEMFGKLTEMGFEAPVMDFEQLEYDSGPFVRTMEVPGEDTPDEVRVEMRLFHSDMFEGERQKHHDLGIEELTKRDVYFYNGHAGPYYGLSLAPSGSGGDVGYQELAEVEMPDKQQLFIAQGCQTYSQYADMIYENPVKSEENLDAITTVNYSYGRGTKTLFENLVNLDSDGQHKPVDFYTIVEDLNSDWINRTKEVFYGVMGIDGNPQMHPQANADAIGESCETASDCGPANAHYCIEGQCTADALAEGSCPDGTEFGYLGQDGTLERSVCY